VTIPDSGAKYELKQERAVFYDDSGGFQLEARQGFFSPSFHKVYVSGPHKGGEREIEEDAYVMYDEIAKRRWGQFTFDWMHLRWTWQEGTERIQSGAVAGWGQFPGQY
jgi:hypothetical protein